VPGDAGLGPASRYGSSPDQAVEILAVLAVGAVLMGTALGIRDLFGEQRIFRREQAHGLSASAFLAGKVIVDISNPFDPAFTGLVTPPSSSGAEEVAKCAPAGAHVVKAFNTLFSNVLAAGGPLDVFMAGDAAHAKASVSAFIKSLGLRPQDTGDLSMAHWLEGAGLLEMGLMTHSLKHTNFFLGVNILS